MPLLPATRPETLVAGVAIFAVVGMAPHGTAVGKPRVLTASTAEMGR